MAEQDNSILKLFGFELKRTGSKPKELENKKRADSFDIRWRAEFDQ